MMNIIKAISKRMSAYRLDVQDFGLYIAITNMLWPIIVHLPKPLFEYVMNKKNKLVIHFLKTRLQPVIDQYQQIEAGAKYNPDAPIWVCWLQGEDNLPELCKFCLKSIRKHNNGHPVALLNSQNYKNYVLLPTYIEDKYRKGLIGQAHFADILRTVLLAEHGGCWIDASILVTGDLPETVFEHAFYSCRGKPDNIYITKNTWSNFFLAAQKGSITFRFVRDMFYEYLSKEDRFIDYFMMDYIMRIGYEEISSIRDEIEMVDYNNNRVHELIMNLHKTYDNNYICSLLKDTYLHKLNWRLDVSDFGKNTIGSKLIKI